MVFYTQPIPQAAKAVVFFDDISLVVDVLCHRHVFLLIPLSDLSKAYAYSPSVLLSILIKVSLIVVCVLLICLMTSFHESSLCTTTLDCHPPLPSKLISINYVVLRLNSFKCIHVAESVLKLHDGIRNLNFISCKTVTLYVSCFSS